MLKEIPFQTTPPEWQISTLHETFANGQGWQK
jgi:hypothetical protein